MSEVRKLDARRRAVFPDRFSPGDLFIEEMVSDDEVVFRLVKKSPVPRRPPPQEPGAHHDRHPPLDPATIRKAIREERDSR